MSLDVKNKEHINVLENFIIFLNKQSDKYILKGGTGLRYCHELDRYSEDIDLNSSDARTIKKVVGKFCDINGYRYNLVKDTKTVQRYKIHYSEQSSPLKIEVSFRASEVSKNRYEKIKGVMVFDIDTLCLQKCTAYIGRDKLRDLYDLTFICNKYWDRLSGGTKEMLNEAFHYKGLDQFDYLIKNQKHYELDVAKLETDFLNACNKIGLLYENAEGEHKSKGMIESPKQKSKDDFEL